MASRHAPAQIEVNRAPVLTLWAAVIAERLGFDRNEALTMGRVVAGLNAYAKGKSLGLFKPAPETVERYLQSKFGDALGAVEQAIEKLAGSLAVDELARSAYSLYEVFRPEVPAGVRGWGAAGVLDLERIGDAAK